MDSALVSQLCRENQPWYDSSYSSSKKNQLTLLNRYAFRHARTLRYPVSMREVIRSLQ